MTRTIFLFLFILTSTSIFATHFRYGNISWNDVGNNTIEFTVETAWRKSFYSISGVGSNFTPIGSISFGDGTSISNPVFTATAIDNNEDWVFGVSVFSHTYSSTGNYTMSFQSCCRINNLKFNGGGSFRVESIVNVGTGNNPPESSLPPIVFLQQNSNPANFTLPATDPDGDQLRFRLATAFEATGGNTYIQPPGLSINPTTGQVTWSTIGYNIGEQTPVTFVIEDLDNNGLVKSKIMLDALLEIVGGITAPYFISPTPTNNTVYDVIPGQNISFDIVAKDDEAFGSLGGSVTINALGLPSGVSLNPTVPTIPGNPISTSFNWTPQGSDGGTYLITFTATDDQNLQASSTVIINVSTDPYFLIPPTPGDGSYYCINPGSSFNETYTACDPEPNDIISLNIDISSDPPQTLPNPPETNGGFPIKLYLPPSLDISPDTPIMGSGCVQASLTGSMSSADWGIYPIEFTVVDTTQKTDTVTTTLIINQSPYFVTVPSDTVTIQIDQLFNIAYTASDDDITSGDSIAYANPAFPYVEVPSWVNFNDDGQGVLTLSGNATLNEIGFHNLKIELHDRTTHFLHTHCSWQFHEFVIEVIPSEVNCSDTDVYIDNNGSGIIDTSFISFQTTLNPDSVYLTTTDFNCSHIALSPIMDTLIVIKDIDTSICIFEATIIDTISPSVFCSNIITYLDNQGESIINPNQVTSTISDNCVINSESLSKNLFNCTNIGDNIIVLTIDDFSGNQASCNVIVTVLDTISPIISCGSEVTISIGEDGLAYVNSADILTNITDNCAINEINISKESFDCSSSGSTETIQITVTDYSGKQSTCTVNINVIDPDGHCCIDILEVSNLTIDRDTSFRAQDLVRFVNTNVEDNVTVTTIANEYEIEQSASLGINAKFEHYNYDGCIAYGCLDDMAHNYNENAILSDYNCETCQDGVMNGDETDIDCGGNLCEPCNTECNFALFNSQAYSSSSPHGATTDGTHYYLTNPSQKIDKLDKAGNLVSSFGSSSVFNFNSPQGIVYADGRLFIGDSGNNRIVVYDTLGTHLNDITSGGLSQPRMIYLYNNTLFVAQWFGNIIQYDLSGNVISTFGTAGGFINGMTVYNDEVYVSTGQSEIKVYGLNGSFVRTYSHIANYAIGIEIFNDQLIIADHNNSKILIYDLDGTLVNSINATSGWAMIKEQDQLAKFTYNDIQYYKCISGGTISGCKDSDAHNFNPSATEDDGTCETCNDGILNGDEEGIDCGGSLCDACTNNCPDLIISEFTYTNGRITMTAKNIGDVMAQGSNRIVMQAYWSNSTTPTGDGASGWTFVSLDPGETWSVSTNQTNSNNRPYLVVVVDRDNTITNECNETNNIAYIEL